MLAATFRTGCFNEAMIGIMEMPDHEPETFQQVCEWMYSGTLSIGCEATVLPAHSEACSADFDRLFKLYVFADKFMIPLLKSKILNTCYRHMILHARPVLHEVLFVYKNTVPRAALRTLVADGLIRVGTLKDLITTRREECLMCPDFIEDVISRYCDKQADPSHCAMGAPDRDSYLKRLEKMEVPDAVLEGEGG